MYIPIGRRLAMRPLGRVADFCPFCRGFRAFTFLQSEMAYRLYGLPVGTRVAVGHARRCESCALESNADPTNYRAIVTDPAADLDALIAATNPDIHRNWAARLLLEDRIKTRKLSAGERTTLLREPFAMADDVLARRNQEGQLDTASRFGCLGTFLLPVACLVLVPMFWNGLGETLELAAVILGASCLAFTYLAIQTDARRHARRAVLPRLVAALRPLDPSAEEVEELFASLREARSPLTALVGPATSTTPWWSGGIDGQRLGVQKWREGFPISCRIGFSENLTPFRETHSSHLLAAFHPLDTEPRLSLNPFSENRSRVVCDRCNIPSRILWLGSAFGGRPLGCDRGMGIPRCQE